MATVCNFERGITFPATAKKRQPTLENVPCLRTANVQEELDLDDLIYVDKAYMKSNPAKFTRADDIIMSSANSKELVGKVCYVHDIPFPMTFGGFILTIRAKNADSKYLFYFLRNEFLSGRFMKEATQTTNIANINTAKLSRYAFPLPPLAEQERIVERIEGLFTKLDAARENAQAVVDAFETRKAAILYRAFSGDLTAKWRETHNVGLSDWRKLLLRDIGEIVTGSTPNTKEKAFYGGSVPFIKPAELNQGRHVARSADTLTDAGKALSRPVRAGATCICCIGSIGKCGMLDMDAVTNQQINSVVPYDFMDDVYVYYYCCSNGFKNALIANSCATTISIINKRKTGLLPIVVPPKAEQQEIARILDGLFEAEGQGKQAAELVIEQIDAMKKVVLGRAFRGELGTNRPGEPPCDIVRTETEGDSI